MTRWNGDMSVHLVTVTQHTFYHRTFESVNSKQRGFGTPGGDGGGMEDGGLA